MSIYDSLPIVARALADQLNTTVTVGGTDAYASVVDGNASINIPYYKNAEELSDAILGFTVHEAAHIRHTEFGLLKHEFDALASETIVTTNEFNEIVSTGRYNEKVLHSLWNIAEDLRIERLIVQNFPGSLRFLQAVRSLVFDGNIEPCDVPATIYLDTMLLCGRERYHGFNTHSDIRRKEFISEFGQVLFDKSIDTLGLALYAETTLGCLEVARKLYDLASEALNPEQDNSPDSSPEDENPQPSKTESEQGKGKSERSDDTNEDCDEATDTCGASDQNSNETDDNGDSASDSPSELDSPDESAATNPDASGNSGSNSPEEGGASSAPQGFDPFADASDDDVNSTVKDISEKFNDLMQDKLTPSQRSSCVEPFKVSPGKSFETSSEPVSRGILASSGLRQSLHGLLQGNQHIRRTHRESGNKIDGRLLASALTGTTKVFKHKSKAIAFNSAFTILLDSSGSMSGDMVEAEAAVISLLYALENQSGVTTSAFHFPHSNGTSVGKLKDRKQTLKQAVNANHFGLSSGGSTPLCASLWPAIADLINTTADQRILIVCTDGEPDKGTSGEIVKMIKSLKSEGMVVIGIGFGRANQSLMTRLFDNTGIAVGKLENLRSTLFNITRSVLVRR